MQGCVWSLHVLPCNKTSWKKYILRSFYYKKYQIYNKYKYLRFCKHNLMSLYMQMASIVMTNKETTGQQKNLFTSIQVLGKYLGSIYSLIIMKEQVPVFFTVWESSVKIKQHLYSGQASILITLTCSPAHLLAPTSHSVIVTAAPPAPELTHSGGESLWHSNVFWHTHSLADSRIENKEIIQYTPMHSYRRRKVFHLLKSCDLFC